MKIRSKKIFFLDNDQTVAIQAMHNSQKPSSNTATQEDQQKYVQAFLKASEKLVQVNTKQGEAYQQALNSAFESYNTMYKYSTKHPFMLNASDSEKIQSAKKHLHEGIKPMTHGVAIQSIPSPSSQHKNQKIVATDEQAEKFITEFESAVHDIPEKKSGNQEKYEAALSHAKSEYNKMYEYSAKHPFVLSSQLQTRMQNAQKKLKAVYKDFLPTKTKQLLDDFSSTIHRVQQTNKTSKNYQQLVQQGKKQYDAIANFSMQHPLTLHPDQKESLEKNQKYILTAYSQLQTIRKAQSLKNYKNNTPAVTTSAKAPKRNK